ncbi:aminoglycoside phosphotransferase family protein [Paenibacillus sp. N3.4]|uniref:aminoglycoside phosphotransferase family protein n=1 Tax=Paenibacillus sp. N3.4 TaxID=2603222 RepID=UPI0011CC1567|nr:aminoglycoside phosphotransferase family protein [Paenibacillus sp. N3.4]TXK83528.1 aminoglycoside phosphotransferase family protein [Paenibacillus sp. N3.4]
MSSIAWIDRSESLDDLLHQEASLTLHRIEQGFEAEVVKISSDKDSFVLKTWSKSSKPDIGFQFRLLQALYEQGVSVSKPVGWGMNPNGDKVLLTTFDGTSIHQVSEKKMADIARLLTHIHQISAQEIEIAGIPKYEFIDYFLRGAKDHPDIYSVLAALVQKASIQQDCFIHGDFHLGNLVEENGRYTVIDWTNGQLGDARYDFAWAFILQHIYLSEKYAKAFRAAYLLESNIQQEELAVFEGLACLRWLLLHRSGGVPMRPKTLERVRVLISRNPFFKNVEFKHFSIKQK